MSVKKGPLERRQLIKQVSRDTGVSESSVYKILSNPIDFSRDTVSAVHRAAARYGIVVEKRTPSASSTRSNDMSGGHQVSERTIRVGVVLPSRPLYFWKEAVTGIEKCKEQLEKEASVSIQLVYAYYYRSFEEEDQERFFGTLNASRLDACIMDSVGGIPFDRFVEEHPHMPMVMFNDTQDYMTEAWFEKHEKVIFIGPDSYDEGRQAAELIKQYAANPAHVALICFRRRNGAQTNERRVCGMQDRLKEIFPETRVTEIVMEPDEKRAASTLARKLYDLYDRGGIDAIYVTSGMTHMACEAVDKIERRRRETIRTFVIGHELSPADHRYLKSGRQKGYVKQDVFSQGATALRDMVTACLTNEKPLTRLFNSAVYTSEETEPSSSSQSMPVSTESTAISKQN